MKQLSSLAVVAGGGALPRLVAQTASAAGARIFVVHLAGDSDGFNDFPCITARPEQLGRIFRILRAHDIHDLVLIGRMQRPRLLDLRPDWTTIKLFGRIAYELCFGGDDALLKSVRRMLEGQGFTLHAAQDFVEDLTAPAGAFSKRNPDIASLDDIHVGLTAARDLGRADTGQAVIVCKGKVVAREGPDGTNAMILRNPAPGGVLVKAAKPQQDMALDLPSVGPDTVRLCAEAGYAGIAIEARAALTIERDEMIALANQHGLFLIGVT